MHDFNFKLVYNNSRDLAVVENPYGVLVIYESRIALPSYGQYKQRQIISHGSKNPYNMT